jgi:hypothetical protein
MPHSSGGKVFPQALCPRLADVELIADRAGRGNPVRRKLFGEHLRGLFLQWVCSDRTHGLRDSCPFG